MKNNLQKLIKKEHTKIIFSFYGIVTLLSLIIPLVMLGFGIYFLVSKVNNYGILWVVVGAVAFLFALRKMKDFCGKTFMSRNLFVTLTSSRIGCILEMKINSNLFCISLDFHYLCRRNLKR